MDFSQLTKGVADIGSAFGGLGSLAAGFAGLFGDNSAEKQLRQQYNYQRKLNEQQQQYAEHNAEVAYNRQLEATRLNPLLQKEGNISAGQSAAFGSGSNSGSVASVGMASPAGGGSISAPPSNADITSKYVQMLVSGSSFLTDSALKAEERKGKQIQNAYDAVTFIARADKEKAESKDAQSKARISEVEANVAESFGMRKADAETRQSEADAFAKEVYNKYVEQLTYTQLLEKQQQVRNLLADEAIKGQERKNLEQTEKLIQQNIRKVQLENIGLGIDNAFKPSVYSADLDYKRAQTEGQRLDNKFNAETLTARKNILTEQLRGLAQSNAPVDIQSYIRDAAYKWTYGDLTESERKKAVGYLNTLIKQEQSNRKNERRQQTIQTYTNFLKMFTEPMKDISEITKNNSQTVSNVAGIFTGR